MTAYGDIAMLLLVHIYTYVITVASLTQSLHSLNFSEASRRTCSGNDINYIPGENQPSVKEYLKQHFTDCYYVIGSIHLQRQQYQLRDLQFLKDVIDVSGYIRIEGRIEDANGRIPFDSLRTIAGRELTQGPDLYRAYNLTIGHSNNQLYSLYIDISGSEQIHVGFKSLLHISRGNVYLRTKSCFPRTMNWNLIMFDLRLQSVRFHNAGSACESSGSAKCDGLCSGGYCWSPLFQDCWLECHTLCRRLGCYDRGKDSCCHADCRGSCNGPNPSDCRWFDGCTGYYNDEGKCVDQCYRLPSYDAFTHTYSVNSDSKAVLYGKFCLDQCPQEVNHAVSGIAVQSSNLVSHVTGEYVGEAQVAIDGDFSMNFVSVTLPDKNQWWKVVLTSVIEFTHANVYLRKSNTCIDNREESTLAIRCSPYVLRETHYLTSQSYDERSVPHPQAPDWRTCTYKHDVVEPEFTVECDHQDNRPSIQQFAIRSLGLHIDEAGIQLREVKVFGVSLQMLSGESSSSVYGNVENLEMITDGILSTGVTLSSSRSSYCMISFQDIVKFSYAQVDMHSESCIRSPVPCSYSVNYITSKHTHQLQPLQYESRSLWKLCSSQEHFLTEEYQSVTVICSNRGTSPVRPFLRQFGIVPISAEVIILEVQVYGYLRYNIQGAYFKHEGACLHQCPPGYQPDLRAECKPCPQHKCSKVCDLRHIDESQEALQKTNILSNWEWYGCTYILGNLILPRSIFTEEMPPYISLEYMERYFGRVEEVTGVLIINPPAHLSENINSLSMFRSLEIVWGDGRWISPTCDHTDPCNGEYTVYISSNSITTLGMPNVIDIVDGNASLRTTSMCLPDPTQLRSVFIVRDTFHRDIEVPSNCTSEASTCSSECANGCVGAGANMCLKCHPADKNCRRCQNYEFEDTCVKSCDIVKEALTYPASGKRCLRCHSQCEEGCVGPLNFECTSCKWYEVNGECVNECPPPTSILAGTNHCITCVPRRECLYFVSSSENPDLIFLNLTYDGFGMLSWKRKTTASCDEYCIRQLSTIVKFRKVDGKTTTLDMSPGIDSIDLYQPRIRLEVNQLYYITVTFATEYYISVPHLPMSIYLSAANSLIEKSVKFDVLSPKEARIVYLVDESELTTHPGESHVTVVGNHSVDIFNITVTSEVLVDILESARTSWWRKRLYNYRILLEVDSAFRHGERYTAEIRFVNQKYKWRTTFQKSATYNKYISLEQYNRSKALKFGFQAYRRANFTVDPDIGSEDSVVSQLADVELLTLLGFVLFVFGANMTIVVGGYRYYQSRKIPSAPKYLDKIRTKYHAYKSRHSVREGLTQFQSNETYSQFNEELHPDSELDSYSDSYSDSESEFQSQQQDLMYYSEVDERRFDPRTQRYRY